MATSKQKEEIEGFATDLYNYLWSQHRFRNPSLEKIFAEKLSLSIEKPKNKVSHFDDNIGDVVLCSQFLYRKCCEESFDRYKSDTVENALNFCLCVLDDVTLNWVFRRDNIFAKVIDTAAIIAEAILFCDAKLDIVIDLNTAPSLFVQFFLALFQSEFFANGGWDELKVKIYQDYYDLHVILMPHLLRMKEPYEMPRHSCILTRHLRDFPVKFPVHPSLCCSECKSPSDRLLYLFFDFKDKVNKLLWEIVANNIISEGELKKLETLKKAVHESAAENNSKNNLSYVILMEEQQEVDLCNEIKAKKHKKKKKCKSKKPSKAQEDNSDKKIEN